MRLLGLLLLVGLLSGCASMHFVPGTLETVRAGNAGVHSEAPFRTVAILPIQTSELPVRGLTKPAPPDTSATNRQQREQRCQKIAYQLQKALYEQLRTKQPPGRRTLLLQPVAETNRRLQQAGITYENLSEQPLARLQQVLGTSEVLRGQTLIFRLPASLTLTANLLLSATSASVPSTLATTSLTLLNCQSGAHSWEHSFNSSGEMPLFGSPSWLSEHIASAVPGAFPYR